jgi:hypothetical protein
MNNLEKVAEMGNSYTEQYTRHYLINKPVLWGTAASSILLIVYFFVLTIANSFTHSVEQFLDMWYWIALLVVGFGLQVGLFTYIRGMTRLQKESGVAASSVAAAGGISTTSMIACCAHHVTDIFPLLGISAAAVFLNEYQNLFIIVGVLSNLIGITLMLKIIQNHKLFNGEQKIFNVIMKLNMNRSLYVVSTLSIFTFVLTLYRSL